MATKAENFAKLQDTLQKAGVDINEYNKAKASGASSADALKAGGYTGTTTNTGTTKTNTATQTSSGMNAVSQSSLDANKNNAQVGTGAVAGFNNTQQRTQELTNRVNQTQQEINNTKSQIAEKWGGLDYDTQQKKLNAISGLKEGLASKGITSKTQPTTQTTTTTPTKTTTTTKQTTPQQDRWDYQDNSQARMDQIADNLDKYRQTQPGLFEDASAFYNFFIDGKGRSQDQIDYLWDYFNRVQKFGKYDNLPASTIGDMLANGKLGDDYLNYLKTTDPAKYQEAISYRQDAEDTIKYESFLSDTADQAGLSGFEKFYKGIFGYRDENDDKIDDSLYIAPTEEEQTKQNRVNTIDSRIMEIKNMQKNLLDDLVEQYPGVPKATLMGIVQDRTKDLQREYDDLMVERTGLVGNIEYMQNERDMQMDARQKTINNLKTAYGMYYDYTAEGISEMAQNKYAATNVTLDQADSGNETQKQMALQKVLDGYYQKYGDIIQRSEQQVINDVIAYAKKNGVGLAQALQENFVKPLQSKPGFTALSSVSATRPNVFKIGEDTYGYWDDNGNLVSVGASITGTGVGTMRTERNNNPTAMTVDVAKSLGGVEGVDYVKGDSFQTGDGRTLYTAKLLGDPIETTIKLLDNAASTGRGAFYTKGGAQRRNHTAMSDAERLKLSPEEKQNVVLRMLQREGGDINKMAGYNQGAVGTAGTGGYNEGLAEIYKQRRDKPDSANAVKDFWNTYGDTISAAGVSKDDFLKQYDEWYEEETADAYLDILSHLDQLIELTGGEYDRGERGASIFGAGDVGRAYDYIKNNLTVQGLRDAKQQGLKLGVLSDSDVRMIGNAATTLSWTQGQKSWNRELNAFREKLLNKNKYLRDRYQNKSAYSDDTSISFNSGDRTFTIGETVTSEPAKKAKSIRNLGK